MLEMFKVLQSLGELIFWAFMLIAVWKYRIMSKLPGWLSWVLILSMTISGIFGLAVNLTK